MSAVLKSEVFQSEALDHLEWLESESIRVLREVVAESGNPALLFTGGMDSIVMLRLAEKAFRPDAFPFPLLHIDTEQNFPEVIAFRDARVAELGERLIVRSVGDSIRSGRIRLRDPNESRNRHKTVTLLDAIQEFGFDVLLGVHVFPLSNWTELDIWRYIARERLAVPSIYTAYDGEWIPRSHSGFAN